MSRHEVHSMSTHSAERRLMKTDKTERSSLQGTEDGGITGLKTLFATALKTDIERSYHENFSFIAT